MNDQIPYELLAKYFTGECTENEKKQLKAWRGESPTNEKIFKELNGIWYNSTNFDQGFNPDAAGGLENVNKKIELIKKTFHSGQKNFTFYPARVAAVLILALAVWVGYNKFLKITQKFTEFHSNNNKKDLKLADGTKVTLNRSTKLIYPEKFNKRARIIKLEGEAFFEVTKNSKKPFIIHAQHTITHVLGTAFNLKAIPGDEEIIITVAEGRVEFTSEIDENAEKIELSAGEKGIYQKTSSTIFKELNNDLNYMAWKTEALNFKNTPLTIVVKDISKYFDIKIRISDVGLDTLSVTLVIPLKINAKEALEALKYITNTEISQTDSIYIVKNKPVK